MHILFITENFPPEVNAAASRVYERACYWRKWGHRVTVITSQPNFPQGKIYPGYKNRWYAIEDVFGIRVVRVKTFIATNDGVYLRTIDFMSFMFMAVIAGLFQKKPDVVAATSPQFFSAVGGWLLAGLRRLPFIFEVGDLWPASIEAVGVMRKGICLRLIEKLELFLYRRAAAVVTLTQSFKNNLVGRGIGSDKIAVVINGVDTVRYMPQTKDEQLVQRYDLKDKFIVGYIGTHGMAHSLVSLLEAAVSLRNSHDIGFIFVGDGALKKDLLAYAAAHNLGNVVFVDPQPKSEIARYWSLYDVALISLKKSRAFEAVIPSKVFEAMAMGLPVLYSGPSGEISRIVENENIGVRVPPEDSVSIADAILKLKKNREFRSMFAGNCIKAASKYTRERQAKNMVEVFAGVIEGRRPCLSEIY